MKKLGSQLRALGRDRGGNTLMLAAFLFPVVIGGMGLGAETGYWYFTQRKLQHAADISAHAAGTQARSGKTKTVIAEVAKEAALKAGFRSGIGKIDVHSPPVSGPSAGESLAVEVVVSETFPRMFSGLFNAEPLTLTARAVSKPAGGGTACILSLAPSAPAAAYTSGSATLKLENCDVAANSMATNAFSMQGSSQLTTGCVYTTGGAVTTSGLKLEVCSSPREYGPLTADPYAGVAEPAVEGACSNGNNLRGTIVPTQTHSSGVPLRCYRGITLQGHDKVEFKPGLYIIDGGDFKVTGNPTITGSGVTFFLTNGAKLDFNGTAHFDLSAPSDPDHPYSGILFFGDRDGTVLTQSMNGDASSRFQGAVYMPNSAIVYSGGSNVSDGCTQIIGYTVGFTGNTNIGAKCEDAGTRDIVAGASVELSE